MYNGSAMNPQRKLSEVAARILTLLLGLFILAQGIAFTILADLGTDAITGPALVAHKVLGVKEEGMGYEFCSVGNLVICVHILLVLMQIALLRSKYNPLQLLQVVMGIILGTMLNVCIIYTSKLPCPGFEASIGYTLVGCVLSAFGIYTFVKADLVPLSAEGLCLALSSTFKWRFSRVKVAVDCTMVIIAVIASLLIFHTIVGVGIGTVICAVSTGYIIGLFFKYCPLWDKVLASIGGGSATASSDLS